MRDEAEKRRLDRQTPYLSLLPEMDEGMHIGYQEKAGIQCDGNQKPREWLENFARFLKTPGREVGYAIPDVLASEQQLRRLARLPWEQAMTHQEMRDYRGILALLLLWDLLAEDGSCAELRLYTMEPDERGGFVRAVGEALSPARAREGLQVFTLCRTQSEHPEPVPLCLLSHSMVLMPAANLGDLSRLLPPSVRWYDREKRCFLDPCGYLDERMISVLVPRLRLLAALNEDASVHSPIYSPEAPLCALLNRMIREILQSRENGRQRLNAGDENAVRAFRTRVMAVYGLGRQETGLRLTREHLPCQLNGWEKNPLLKQLVNAEYPLPELPEGEEVQLYLLDGAAFARQSDAALLEPAGTEGEDALLRRIGEEIALLDRWDEGWQRQMSLTLAELADEIENRTGLCPCVPGLLRQWSAEYAAMPHYGDSCITLRYPEDTSVRSVSPLLNALLGEGADGWLAEPFSQGLLMAEGETTPFAPEMTPYLRVEGAKKTTWFAPPLSPALARWLEEAGERPGEHEPHLLPESLCCRLLPEGVAEARFALGCRVDAPEGLRRGQITFVRRYRLCALPEEGGASALDAAALPSVTVWPNVRLNGGQWRQYFVHTHQPENLDVWSLSQEGWVQGPWKTAENRRWQTACVERFPAMIVLKRGGISLGALVNDRPVTLIRHEEEAAAGLDFGSIATTVMLRLGEKTQPAALPEGLYGRLLGHSEEAWLTDEFLSEQTDASACYSVMEMFGDEPEKWRGVLQDGHIYAPRSLTALLNKPSRSLYYDLKWSDENYALRCLRLFLKQVMLQTSLAALLSGAPALSWRVSMPGALPPYRQEAYLEMVRGLAREVAKETGMPLSARFPAVLYALENQADGWYFLSRSEVDARGGYLNLDIGGSTADLSLWLGGKNHAAAESSLLLGCRQMLYASFARGHGAEFATDFAQNSGSMAEAAAIIANRLDHPGSLGREAQKTMLLMDDFFAAYAPEIRQAMEEARAGGRVSYTECLLLFQFGFLFYLAGLMMERAWQEPELRPLMPVKLVVCIAGNGGQLMKTLSREQADGLCRMALEALSREHPTEALMPVQSDAPKREAALGLLYEDGDFQSTLQSRERWNGTFTASGQSEENRLTAYLLRFAKVFPQAANRLFGSVCSEDPARGGVRLAPSARMELETIWANERAKHPEDDFAAWVGSLTALKQLWKI